MAGKSESHPEDVVVGLVKGSDDYIYPPPPKFIAVFAGVDNELRLLMKSF